jgi:hypothetical protein
MENLRKTYFKLNILTYPFSLHIIQTYSLVIVIIIIDNN